MPGRIASSASASILRIEQRAQTGRAEAAVLRPAFLARLAGWRGRRGAELQRRQADAPARSGCGRIGHRAFKRSAATRANTHCCSRFLSIWSNSVIRVRIGSTVIIAKPQEGEACRNTTRASRFALGKKHTCHFFKGWPLAGQNATSGQEIRALSL